MDSVEFQGNARDLERFAAGVLKQTARVEELSPFERRMSWEVGGNAGFSSAVALRSGLKLHATQFSWDEPWKFQFRTGASPLKFMLGRGAGPRMTLSQGTEYVLGAGLLQVAHSTSQVNATCEFVEGGAEFEQLALEITPENLRDLLGASVLPQAIEGLLHSPVLHAMHEQPMTPALTRLLEELMYLDARGPSRQLLLESKGLGLLAALLDELAPASEALSPLTSRDIERLERARQMLLDRMVSPPGLPELARAVGLNEFKLKAGFRTLFGASVFGYLRTQRMEEARRLLHQADLSVTTVAARVGYSNPSKFAAAFKKQFGLPPSALR